MSRVLQPASRRDFYTIIIGTWLMVTIYAILHDQYLVRICPEHFTVYHNPLWGIKNPPLLAAAYAYNTGHMLYGARWYPDDALPLITTQTIQLTCYLSSALFSCVLFVILIRKRLGRRKTV